MAKEQSEKVEYIEPDTIYFIKEITEFPRLGGWGIFSKTKYGNKLFNSYRSKEVAIRAAEYHKLTLLSEQEEV